MSVPFRLPWSEAPSWRNAYRGEGFLHPDIRPAPPMKDFQVRDNLVELLHTNFFLRRRVAFRSLFCIARG